MSPTLYHTFNGFAKGLSSFHINPIDIRKIIDIQYRKRLFCILDIEYKYTLEIEYSIPTNRLSISPVIVFGNLGIANNINNKTSIMTLRYKTEKEVINIIEEIKMKQNLISQFDNEQNKKLQEFVDVKINK